MMKTLVIRTAPVWAVLLLLTGALQTAHAYIPPSQYLVKRMAERKNGIKTLKISSTVVAMENDKPTSVHFKEVTEFDFFNGVLQSTAYDDDNTALYRVVRSLGPSTPPEPQPLDSGRDEEEASTTATAASETQDVAINVTKVPPADFLLLDGNYNASTLALLKWGVPVKVEEELLVLESEIERRKAEVTALKRWEERLAWVVGRTDGPQLWVEKDSFLPLRMVWTPDNGDGLTELAFRNYRFFKTFPYPSEIGLTSGSKQVLRSELTQLQLNVPLRGDAGSGASTAAAGSELQSQSGFTDAGNAADSLVRNLITRYYGLVR